MAVDTVKLRSPTIDAGTADYLEKLCILKSGIQLSTGEILYEITTGSLDGSWDSRISFKVCREDWIASKRNGKLEQIPCDPYVMVEASIHKFFYGQNIYGNPTNFPELCRSFINCLGEMLAGEEYHQKEKHKLLPDPFKWQVRRVDWAEMFAITPAAQVEYFRALKNCKFPRRALKEAKYDTAVHFPGKFTTLRIYGKGAEFKKHEIPRIRHALTAYAMRELKNFKGNALYDHTLHTWIEQRIKALQRLSNNRLRSEVQINADKLHHDFNGRYPLVNEITDKYLIVIYNEQIFKLLKEGKSAMETVRTYDAVQARLNLIYSRTQSNSLFAFWLKLALRGEEPTRLDYTRTSFYRSRKMLVDIGVSWNSSDVFVLPQDTALPRDFVPLTHDTRRCTGKVSNNSIFNFCPVEQHELLKAA